MINVYEFEEKKVENIEDKIATELNTEKEDLLIYKKELEGGFLKGKKTYIKAVKKEDLKKYIKTFLENLSKLMNIDIKSEVNEKDGAINAILVTDNNAVLIGKDGRTLKSLQILIRQAIKSQTGFNIHLNMDVGGYKKSRQKKLEYTAKKIAKEVLNTKVDSTLDPMNSFERRVVHSVVSKFEGLKTESKGIEPERYIIIKYVK